MKSLILALAGVVCAPCAVWAQSSMAPDAGEAARGSVTGTFAQSFGASALSRGTFSLPSPFDVPSEEGSPLWNIFPTYSPDAGLSEWGMGWQSSLSITRYRPDGELRFTAQGFDRPNADRFTGPWGPMSFSVSQQAWYPDGFRQMVKVVGPITTVGGTSAAARHFCAYMPGGGIAHFRESRENYSWYVDVVQDVHGSKTTIDYDSESGRMLVKSMSYGGVGSYVSDCDALPATAAAETRPYRVELGYAAIDQSAAHIVSLAGARARTQPSSLRHRVSSVLALVRDQPRWHFVLTQHRNPFVPGTWYLESVQKIFASGERLPPMRYTYDTSGGDLLRTEPIDAPLLTNFLRGEDLTAQQFFPPSNPMASGTIPYDRNRDGLMDLIVKADRPSAHAAEHQFFRRDATGFVPNGRAVMPDQFPSPIDGSPTHLTRTLVSASPLRPGGALRFMTYSEEYYVPLTPGTTTPLRPTRRVEFFRSTAGTNPNANATFGPAVGTSIEIDTSITVAGPWVADIDGDHKPDLLFVSRAHGFHLVVRFNTTDANDVPTFSTPRALPEAGGFTSQVWVADLNGDGLADLLWRSSGTGRLHAHLRLGGEPLSADGSLPFTDTAVLVDGDEWPGNARFTFLDANRDGLTDILAVTPLGPRLYLNNGTTAQGQSFVEMFVPAFDSIWLTQNVGDVLVGDLVGDGEEHALFFTQNDGAATVHDIPLTTPSTGLMTAVDDGQGNHYRFRYKRADPQPGLAQRISVLEAVDVTSTGEIDRRYTYAFSGPVSHSLGGFFLGFTQAISTLRATDAPSPSGTPFSREVAEFSHDDVHSSLLTDRTISRPDGLGIVRAERYLYELPTMLFGLPRRRLGLTSVSVGGELIAERTTTSTRVRTYDALGLCPTLVERSEPGASVTTETLYDAAAPARLTEVPGCFARQVTARDDHGSVPMTVGYTRNERGQVLTVTADPLDKPVGVPPIASTPLTTTMSYDAHGMLTSVARPGRGSTTFTYRSDRPMMLARVDRPDGTFSTAGELHPLFGVPLSMTTHTGYTQRFTFDGEERIATQSDNASNTWEQRPLVRLSYQRPNDTRLGAVETHGLIDGPSNAERTAIGLFSASGRRLASALQVVGGYAISGVSEQDPTRGTARAFVQPQILADPKNARLADLTQGAHLLASATVDAIGMPMTSVQTLHDDADGLVQRALSFTQTSSSAGLTATVRENNDPALETESFVSASGALLSYRDQAGQEGVYSYDGFTRLRHVTLPGAAGQPRDEADVQYDAHGRVSVVERWAASANHQPITRFDYSYDATTGLLRMKTVSVAGVVQRRELFNYDPIGRATAHVFGDASGPGGASVDTRTFLFFYDGRTLERDAPVADQKGQLTGISGKGFSKTFTYGIDGRLLGASIDVLGERAVVSSFEYFDDGSPKSETVDVLSPREGATACMSERISKEIGLDVLGRPRQLFVNGELFADIAYDERSRVESVSLTDGSVLAPKYDSFTLASTGFVRYTPDVSTLSQLESSVRYGPRGLVAKEKMESAAGMVERVYGYNQQGFLTSSSDGHGYIYDAASGLSTQIDGANVTRSGSTLTLAAATQVVQTFDALGRVTRRRVGGGETQYTYGPQNQIESARTPAGDEYDYLYDESGQRLAKVRRSDGKIALAYVGGGVHDGAGLTAPISVAGVHVGTLRRGGFTAHASDTRGTVLGASAGAGVSSLPSPYGARSVQPDVASATSFIEQPFDRDLGLVRLGLRDYDPAFGRFAQPDPLYHELPSITLGDHVGGNLYSYAGNDPVNFVDPWGLKDQAREPEVKCRQKSGDGCSETEVTFGNDEIEGDLRKPKRTMTVVTNEDPNELQWADDSNVFGDAENSLGVDSSTGRGVLAAGATFENRPQGSPVSAGSTVNPGFGLAAIAKIPVPGTNLLLGLSAKGIPGIPSSGSTWMPVIKAPTGRPYLALDYGFNKAMGTVNSHWQQRGTLSLFGRGTHASAGAGGVALYRAAQVIRYGGPALLAFGAAQDAFALAAAENRAAESARILGAWTSAYASAKVLGAGGAYGGTLVAPGLGTMVGGLVGAVVGGGLGYYLGGLTGISAYGWSQRP